MILSLALALAIATPAPSAAPMTPRQIQVRRASTHVMPFSLDRSMHAFEPTPQGGTMTVHTHANDPGQIELIRAHLRGEALAFARGDYADPASIHGSSMPGLAELRAGHASVTVRYAAVPDGAEISFVSKSPALIAALHRWFAAQVADHGHDAMMM